MTQIDQERALRAALHEVVADQPLQPVDRVAGVRRRHVRRRTMQGAATAMAAAIAVVASLLAGGVVGRQGAEPLNRPVPSWALPWPDHRDGSVSQEVLDGVLAAWRSEALGRVALDALPAERVVWYAAQKVDNGESVFVMFEVDTGNEYRLVVGVTATAQSTHWMRYRGQRLPPPWRLYDVPAPPPSYRGLIGTNFGTSFTRNGLALLAPPDVSQISWIAAGSGSGTVRLADGFATFEIRAPRGPVKAGIPHPGVPVYYQPLGVPGDPRSQIGQLARVPRLDGIPPGAKSVRLHGQGKLAISDATLPEGATTTIYARCYGPLPIRVAVDDDRTDGGVRIPCDDQQHVVEGPRLGKPTVGGPGGLAHQFMVNARYDVAWRVAVVIEPAA